MELKRIPLPFPDDIMDAPWLSSQEYHLCIAINSIIDGLEYLIKEREKDGERE